MKIYLGNLFQGCCFYEYESFRSKVFQITIWLWMVLIKVPRSFVDPFQGYFFFYMFYSFLDVSVLMTLSIVKLIRNVEISPLSMVSAFLHVMSLSGKIKHKFPRLANSSLCLTTSSKNSIDLNMEETMISITISGR